MVCNAKFVNVGHVLAHTPLHTPSLCELLIANFHLALPAFVGAFESDSIRTSPAHVALIQYPDIAKFPLA